MEPGWCHFPNVCHLHHIFVETCLLSGDRLFCFFQGFQIEFTAPNLTSSSHALIQITFSSPTPGKCLVSFLQATFTKRNVRPMTFEPNLHGQTIFQWFCVMCPLHAEQTHTHAVWTPCCCHICMVEQLLDRFLMFTWHTIYTNIFTHALWLVFSLFSKIRGK